VPQVHEALAHAARLFTASDSARLDAELLLAHVLGKSRSWLLAWPEQELASKHSKTFDALCVRRAQGEPVAYLLGKRAFWTFQVDVNADVLIPRPESELLVEQALQLGEELSGKVADLGTGSGAIAWALASERPDWEVYATELSPGAQVVAAANFRKSNLSNVHLLSGSWCRPLPGRDYALLVSNPPYIDAADPHLGEGDLRFEPRSALVAGEAGLADLRAIAHQAREYLVTGGWLLLEHGWEQGAAVRGLLAGLGYTGIATHHDHGNRERVTVGRA
jgi:release factor glutamine methyltransferase